MATYNDLSSTDKLEALKKINEQTVELQSKIDTFSSSPDHTVNIDKLKQINTDLTHFFNLNKIKLKRYYDTIQKLNKNISNIIQRLNKLNSEIEYITPNSDGNFTPSDFYNDSFLHAIKDFNSTSTNDTEINNVIDSKLSDNDDKNKDEIRGIIKNDGDVVDKIKAIIVYYEEKLKEEIEAEQKISDEVQKLIEYLKDIHSKSGSLTKPPEDYSKLIDDIQKLVDENKTYDDSLLTGGGSNSEYHENIIHDIKKAKNKLKITMTNIEKNLLHYTNNNKLIKHFKELLRLLQIKNEKQNKNGINAPNTTNSSCDPSYIQSHINEQVRLQINKTIQELEKTQMETLKINEIKQTLDRISKEFVKPNTNNKQLTYYIEDILNLLKKNNVNSVKKGGHKKRRKSKKSHKIRKSQKLNKLNKLKKLKTLKKNQRSQKWRRL